MNIGYVGLGETGGLVVERLLRMHPVMVFDRRPGALEPFSARGAVAAPDPATLARHCDLILVRVPAAALRDLVFGPQGLADGLSAGKILVDQGCGDPIAARRLAAELAQRGVDVVDASLCEAVGSAGAGALSIVCGGRLEAFEQVRPVLECIDPAVMHCGPAGSGHAARLINNALDACNRLITCEMAALGVKLGLNTALMASVINGKGSGRSDASERVLPALGSDRRTTRLSLRRTAEELTRTYRLAAAHAAPLFLANVVRSLVEAGASQFGADANPDDLAHLYETLGGCRFSDG